MSDEAVKAAAPVTALARLLRRLADRIDPPGPPVIWERRQHGRLYGYISTRRPDADLSPPPPPTRGTVWNLPLFDPDPSLIGWWERAYPGPRDIPEPPPRQPDPTLKGYLEGT